MAGARPFVKLKLSEGTTSKAEKFHVLGIKALAASWASGK